jgi:hypothetical protein
VIAVDSVGDVVERGNKCRAASLTLVRRASEDEIRAGLLEFSACFGVHQVAMAEEQWLWYRALGRPERDRPAVVSGLNVALEARGLKWGLREFPSTGAARAAWAARAARDARDAWAAWAAWDARAAWAAWAARAAWDAWDARDAWVAWDAWDAWAALTVQFAVRSAWISRPNDVLTVGIRDAYYHGLGIALPTGPNELGWAMDDAR